MKLNWVPVLGLAGTLLAAASGCGGAGKPPVSPEGPAPLKVAVTIRALGLIVEDLIPPEDRGKIALSVIVPQTASAHGYEPPPSQMAALAGAEVLVANGMGLDDWATRSPAPGQVLVRFEDIPGARLAGSGEPDPHPPDQFHHSLDQHLWFDPALVRPFASRLSESLRGRVAARHPDPGLEQRFAAALQRFHEGTFAVERDFASRLEPFRGRRVIVFHDALHRICARYGITIGAVLRPIEEAEPSASDLRTAIEQVRSHGVRAVFVEPQFSPQAARRIAEATGARLVSVDPHGMQAHSWRQMMEAVLASLLEALGA